MYNVVCGIGIQHLHNAHPKTSLAHTFVVWLVCEKKLKGKLNKNYYYAPFSGGRQ